jgi:hypothetical protein
MTATSASKAEQPKAPVSNNRMRIGLAVLFTIAIPNLAIGFSVTTTGDDLKTRGLQLASRLRHSQDDELPPTEAHLDGFRPRRTHLFSFADSPKQQVCLLAAGAAQYGYEVNMLGWNKSESFADGTSCGEPCKLKHDVMKAHERKIYWQHDLTQKYAEYGIHDDDLIVFTDAFDVLIQSDPGRIADLFLQQTRNRRGVVFNGEPTIGSSFLLTGDYGDRLRRGQYEVRLATDQSPRNVSGNDLWKLMAAKTLMTAASNGPFFGLNSGIFVGDPVSLRTFFEHVLEVKKTMTDTRGDQILYQVAYVRYPELNMVVDTAASISYVQSYLYRPGDVNLFSTRQEGNKTVTTCLAEEYLTAATPGSKIRFGTDSEPVFMHFPGDFKPMYGTTCWKPTWTALAATIGANTTGIRDFDRGQHVPLSAFCKAPE